MFYRSLASAHKPPMAARDTECARQGTTAGDRDSGVLETTAVPVRLSTGRAWPRSWRWPTLASAPLPTLPVWRLGGRQAGALYSRSVRNETSACLPSWKVEGRRFDPAPDHSFTALPPARTCVRPSPRRQG